jgi:serine/threonine-protein kinase
VERFGRYELITPLGVGGMGEVFLARARGPERVQKTVVLKRLRPARTHDAEARARFVEEARVAISLAHPHVVPVFELGQLDGTYFLVMEWARGGDLSRVAGIDRPRLGWAAAALLGSQLCDALAYVHARQDRRGARLVHGDVTPKNVLLSRDGHALLADFGLARFAPRGRAGTRRYLAPEQARGEPSDGRADLYALALVLTEAVTGRPALDRDPERAARQARVGVVPELDGCDPGLAAVLARALAPARDARFADATQARDAFDALLDREPRGRATGRAELTALIAARAQADGAPALERSLDPSALATRQATAAPRVRAALAIASLLLVAVGAAGVGARAALRRRGAAPSPASATATPRITVSQPVIPTPPSAIATPPSAIAIPPSTVAISPAVVDVSQRVTPPSLRPAPRPHVEHHPAASPLSPGVLDLNAVPWAHVRIDGQLRGETPLLAVALSPGAHEVELVNEPLGVRRVLRVEVKPGERVERIEDLSR